MKRSENNDYMSWKERQVEINQIIIYSLTFMLKGYSCENTVMPGPKIPFVPKLPFISYIAYHLIWGFEEGVS